MTCLRNFILFFFLFVIQTLDAQDIFQASRNGDVKSIKQILSKDSSQANAKNEQGFSPLILAAYRNQPKVVKILLMNGADLNYSSQEGTALLGACYKGNYEIARMLLERGASVKPSGPNGVSPLIFAAQSNNEKLVQLLLNFKADKHLKDQNGKSALDYAKELEFEGIQKLLQE